ncbi:MAG TPA: dienelactone hydrolase family protein [Candidatus Polarisedimenticolia bacterium]|nr:dienelactone hydrolase family protein [Candidatus Polarisedimenticolia bacterium]
MAELLRAVEIETGGKVRASILWLHGLGADGHDFEPIVPHLGLDGRGVRFIFPHAPRRAVTINMGLLMPAWFDVRAQDFSARIDDIGIRASAAQVEALLARERERGVPAERILLAGFSQGGVIALHVALRAKERLAGAIGLSTFLPGMVLTPEELTPDNAGLPVFMAHGDDDPLIPLAWAQDARDRLIALAYPVVWKTYPMEHQVCAEEIADLATWIGERLG